MKPTQKAHTIKYREYLMNMLLEEGADPFTATEAIYSTALSQPIDLEAEVDPKTGEKIDDNQS